MPNNMFDAGGGGQGKTGSLQDACKMDVKRFRDASKDIEVKVPRDASCGKVAKKHLDELIKQMHMSEECTKFINQELEEEIARMCKAKKPEGPNTAQED